LLGHPNFAASRVNAALVEAISDLDNVTVHDLYAAYPDFQIDVAKEQELLLDHDTIVLQFPLYWFNTTPLLRKYQDDVLVGGWAFNYDGSPSATAGKKSIVVTSTGGDEAAYQPEGRNGVTVKDLLNNLSLTFGLCQFQAPEFFQVNGVHHVTDEELATKAAEYRALLAK
jgi:glutathione-regulated potassium-efflux system ancillary protein KefG